MIVRFPDGEDRLPDVKLLIFRWLAMGLGVHGREQRYGMQVTTAMGDALGRYLDLTADQMKLTAGNLANIDTPGYKAQGMNFEQEFASALHGTGSAGPKISDVDGLVARPDGNTVSLDRESMQLAKSQLQFRTGVELLRHQFSSVMSAIHAEMK